MESILITGGNGQLGSELKKMTLEDTVFNYIFTDVDALDITDFKQLSSYFSIHNIRLIINCAAYTAVDKAEKEQSKAQLVNAEAVGNLAKICKVHNAKIIHISTDYVFDGSNSTPYEENTPTKPQTVYGKTKLKGEQLLQNSGAEYIIIRTSWLYSSFGHNFVKTILKNAQKYGKLNVVFDQIGTPTYARDLAQTCLAIAKSIVEEKSFQQGIYHYSNEGVASWYDFAQAIIKLAKINCKVTPIETKHSPSFASRPYYSVLDKTKIKKVFNLKIPYWHDSLKLCMEEISKVGN